jgi:propanol-preferring alcohol dehydrogenase
MTPTTMLAAVYQPGNNKLVLDKHYPIRALKDDEILLKVSAAGGAHISFAFLLILI